MKLPICPFVGAGALRFGMCRNEIRSALQSEYTSYLKGDDTKADAFDSLGIHVYYNDHEQCEAIEFYGPCQPVLDSVQLLDISYSKLKSQIKAIDPKLEEDDVGFISCRAGIGAYAPSHMSTPEASVDSVIIFREGYYGNTMATAAQSE